jgi:hypothetical protein
MQKDSTTSACHPLTSHVWTSLSPPIAELIRLRLPRRIEPEHLALLDKRDLGRFCLDH